MIAHIIAESLALATTILATEFVRCIVNTGRGAECDGRLGGLRVGV